MPFYRRGDVELHFLERSGPGPAWLVLHGLTANSRAFDSLGFPASARLPDLRGRGLSDQPEDGYSLEEHALDVLELIEGATTVVGHSFGGLLGLYLAARYPEKVARVMLLDAAVGVANPRTLEVIGPSLQRLGRTYASFEDYFEQARAAGWPAEAEPFCRADVRELPDGRVICRTRPETLARLLTAVQAEDWLGHSARVRQPVRLLRAENGIVGPEQLQATRSAIPQLELATVAGDHFTMIYGQGAHEIERNLGEPGP